MQNRKDKRELSYREEVFLEQYAKHRNAGQAAVEAGYSEKSKDQRGHELLERPQIKARLDAMKKKAGERMRWDFDRTLKEFIEVKEKALGDEHPNYSAAVKAIENVAKLLNHFPAEKKEINVSGVEIRQTRTFAELKEDAAREENAAD